MQLQSKLKLGRTTTRLTFGSLLVVLTANAWLQHLSPVSFAIILLPLMLFIPGMLRDNPRTLIWICFVTLMYFAVSVDNLAGPAPNTLDLIESLLCVVLFVAAMMFSRWKQQQINLQHFTD